MYLFFCGLILPHLPPASRIFLPPSKAAMQSRVVGTGRVNSGAGSNSRVSEDKISAESRIVAEYLKIDMVAIAVIYFLSPPAKPSSVRS